MNFFKRAVKRIHQKMDDSFLLFAAVVAVGIWAAIAVMSASIGLLVHIGFSAWTAAITTVAVLPLAVVIYHALKD